ncbi:UDP-3-O-(3-hydroxymyristoyl)glucosamine N-acyltransferase [Pontivivens insulae]|uniref:UDP-3-O-acylglucosamine N-acyltransferase n=1 Tax=Pontivivens insulae TaxID=1639689 RepID=A0A2R8ABN3_9RHOB|nr:UDP-3-O-(3-hydroxymyristoyl)glucosamine N-acyltransferase [Pontivivens insulae]RED11205.1 UDP-3-O-[3-hydroxymyristoyl] glucosamine N-acyltransferase [Pontivivens insulae]SPF29622.1 UDP-3-O-acylglucosamine N-acyltransferase [Pontivivens insulae]
MAVTVGELAELLGADAAGDLHAIVSRPAQPDEAREGDLALAMEPRFLDALATSPARVAIVLSGTDWSALGLDAVLFSGRSKYTLAGLSRVFDTQPSLPEGIHPTAVVDDTATLGEGCRIGPYVVIGPQVAIGARARIEAHVSIGARSVVGDDAQIFAGCRIAHDVRIGDRFIGQSNAVIGGDGFSFVSPQPSAAETYMATGSIEQSMKVTEYVRINSLGGVVIGDDVEVGPAATIDKGTVTDTRIGNGTKLDSQAHVGHNVQIGENVLLCGQSGIAGSTKIGDRVILGGQVGVADNISIGADSIALAGSGVTTRVPERTVVMGYPALKQDVFLNIFKAMRRLPRMAQKLTEMQKQVPNDRDTG